MGGVLLLIWVNREEDYFHGKGWTDFWVICPSGKSGEQSDLPYLQCGLPSEPSRPRLLTISSSTNFITPQPRPIGG
jgi:hypothetical protein